MERSLKKKMEKCPEIVEETVSPSTMSTFEPTSDSTTIIPTSLLTDGKAIVFNFTKTEDDDKLTTRESNVKEGKDEITGEFPKGKNLCEFAFLNEDI